MITEIINIIIGGVLIGLASIEKNDWLKMMLTTAGIIFIAEVLLFAITN